MIQLTQQMRDLIEPALAKGYPCLVATASKMGFPISATKAASWCLTTTRWPVGSARYRGHYTISRRIQTS